MTSRTRSTAIHRTACCGPVPAGDASEHLVHRLLLALAAHPDGATVDQLQTYLGGVPPEALDRRIHDLWTVGMATYIGHEGWWDRPPFWTLTDRGRSRAAELEGARWRSSRSTPTAAPTAGDPPRSR